jgi:ribosomal protein L37E
MGQTKVRCQICGAKNTDEKTERCRICGGVLPDAAERRKKAEEGETFKALVEAEVDTWRDYTEGRFDAGGRSRRPAELPPVLAQRAVPGQEMASTPAPVSLSDPVPLADPVPQPEAPANDDLDKTSRLRRFLARD